MVKLLKKYLDIDEKGIDMNLERRNPVSRLVANIPLKGSQEPVRGRKRMAEKSGSSWREIRANIDLLMLFATIALFLLGISAIYSASPNKAFTLSSFAVRQPMWGRISAVIYVMILRIGYEGSWILPDLSLH